MTMDAWSELTFGELKPFATLAVPAYLATFMEGREVTEGNRERFPSVR